MKTLQGSGLPETALGGAGYHPAVAKHFQQEAATQVRCPNVPGQAPTSANQAGTSPTGAVAEFGGGACHPLIAKHLQLRMLAAT